MSRILLRASSVITLLALILTPLAALAHETIEAGDYIIEYGWDEEPPIAGATNAIAINITGKEADLNEAAENAKLSLAAPSDNSTVQGDSVEVTIAVEGVDEHDTESLHWHLKVDETTLTMAPLHQTTITITGLNNGTHTIEAIIALADHHEVGEAAKAVIKVEGSSATGVPSVTGVEPMAESEDHGHAEDFQVDVSGLKVEVVYGGQTTALALQPKEGGDPGEFIAPFTPERPGLYTLRLSGTLGGDLGQTEVSAEVEPEEVTPAPDSAPGEAQTSAGLNTTAWVVIVIVGVLLAGAVVGGFLITRKK